MTKTKACILVIDDEAPVRSGIRVALEMHGHQVYEASDGEKGVRLQREVNCDIAIVDLIMPHKDGLATIRELRALHPDLGIMAISGEQAADKGDYLMAATLFGATTTLSKPFEAEELIEAIELLLTIPI